MAQRKQEEVLVIYIKSVVQLVCSLCVIITVIGKDWISGQNTISEFSVFGCLNELCIRSSTWPFSGQRWQESDVSIGVRAGKMESVPSQVDIGISVFGTDKLGGGLDSESLYGSMFRQKRLSHQRHVLNLDTQGRPNKAFQQLKPSEGGENPRAKEGGRLKHRGRKRGGFYVSSFDQIQYCISHTNNEFLKKWYIHPNYVSFLVLLLALVSVIFSLSLTRLRNKWSPYELLVPFVDFAVFSVSLLNLAQILHVFIPLLTYLQKHNFAAYLSTNFFIYSASIGGFFIIFALSVGVVHYRYETFTNMKRFEEEIENIQSFTSFIHLISNSS